MPEAFVTLATSDAYCMGSLVVGKGLRRHGTTRKLVVMVSPKISREACLSLEDVFDEVIVVDILDSRDRAHLFWLGRPDLGVTFTKLHCWTLTQYTKCVFLDADTLVLCNVDELFEREELSAAPDPGWPDCFNSGVFVFRPSLETHSRLLEHAQMCGSFDGGDQGLLNSVFSDWAIKDITKHLPFIYNLSINAIYTYLPAFHKYGHQAKIVHFLGKNKPWHIPYKQKLSTEVSQWDLNKNLEKFVNLWWEEYYGQTKTHECHNDKPMEQLERLAAAPCSTHVANVPNIYITDLQNMYELCMDTEFAKQASTPKTRSPFSATSPAVPPHPHCSESVSQAEEKKMPSKPHGKMTLDAPCLSTCHHLKDQCSDPDVVSAADPKDLGNSELQQPPAEQKRKEEVSDAESAPSDAKCGPSDAEFVPSDAECAPSRAESTPSDALTTPTEVERALSGAQRSRTEEESAPLGAECSRSGTHSAKSEANRAPPGAERAPSGSESAPSGSEFHPPGAEIPHPGTEFARSGPESAPSGAESTHSGAECAPPGAECAPPGAESAPPGAESVPSESGFGTSGAECAPSGPPSDSATLEALKEDFEHRKRWEAGHIDYLGRDAFENIRLKLDQFLD